MALFKMIDQVFTRYPYIGKNTHGNILARNGKTIGVYRIMLLRKRNNAEIVDSNRLVMVKIDQLRFGYLQPCMLTGIFGYIQRKRKPVDQGLYSPDMVGMFVRYKYTPHFVHTQLQASHTAFYFSARQACIYQYSVLFIAYIIAIAIAARCQCGEKYRHKQQRKRLFACLEAEVDKNDRQR